MRIADYKATNLNRVNPEFVGIAQKYHQQKKNRLDIQQKRNSLLNNLKFKMSIDSSLEKSLENKKEELNRVKQTRDKRVETHQQKSNNSERRKMDLQDLRIKSTRARNQTKQGIRNAHNRILQEHKKGRQDLSAMFVTMRSQFSTKKQGQMQQNQIRFKSIKEAQKHCHATVDGFHRNRNLQSLSNYKQLIQEEALIVNKISNEISTMQTSIQTYDRRIDNKKRNLYEVLDEISLYSLEPRQEHMKCLPFFLRENRLLSSQHSSRPSDILLKGAKNLIKQNQSLQLSHVK